MSYEKRKKKRQEFLEPSKVKDLLYHGTNKNIRKFSNKMIGRQSGNRGFFGSGFYLSGDPEVANSYADTSGGNVMPLHVNLNNPLFIHDNLSHEAADALNNALEVDAFQPGTKKEHVRNGLSMTMTENPDLADMMKDNLINQGYDGVVYGNNREVVAFHPHQIKSAIGNRGTYSATNSDITKSKGGIVSLLRKHGRPAESDLDAMRKMSNGHRVFVAHEQDEAPREIKSVSEMHGYTPDQIYTIDPKHFAKGGKVKEPNSTVKAYKLFRVHPSHPGKLFPLFVDANTPVEMNKWVEAKEGEMVNGKVKSKIGALAYRPGWHAGDLPIATHIGEKSDPSLTAPDTRPANHVWAEVEMPNDVDWQSIANERGMNEHGKIVPVKAHITDQIPLGGHYRYKTNPNMTGNWLIGGAMKVNKVLTDKQVEKINKAAGLSDLPRAKPFNPKMFGFAHGGLIAPEEWVAEEHVHHEPNSRVTHAHHLDIEERPL